MKVVIPSRICIQGDSQVVVFSTYAKVVLQKVYSLKGGFHCLDIHIKKHFSGLNSICH